MHVVEPLQRRDEPVTDEVMNERIEEAAVQNRSYGQIPRVALFDIAYPIDAVESGLFRIPCG